MVNFNFVDPEEYFDRIRRHKHVILFGCGGKGREAVPILAEHGIFITAACDNNKALWGKNFVDGIIIQEFEQAMTDLEDCCVIISSTVIYATEIYQAIIAKYPDMPIYHLCSPFKVEDGLLTANEAELHKSELYANYQLMQDEESRRIYLDTLSWKMTGNMIPLNQYELGNTDYSFFDDDLIQTNDQSVYVDIGAYTGDTIASFLMFSRGKFVQFSRVQRIEIHNAALWSREENKVFYTNSANNTIHFDSPNLFRSVDAVADNLSLDKMQGKLEGRVLNVKTIDTLLENDVPTIIKINALAADREIILGGGAYIGNYKPTLILEFGVTKRDVFEMIPLIKQLNDKYRFYMRRKRVFKDVKTVLYCV